MHGGSCGCPGSGRRKEHDDREKGNPDREHVPMATIGPCARGEVACVNQSTRPRQVHRQRVMVRSVGEHGDGIAESVGVKRFTSTLAIKTRPEAHTGTPYRMDRSPTLQSGSWSIGILHMQSNDRQPTYSRTVCQ